MRNKILSCFLFVFVCTNSWAGVWHDKCVADLAATRDADQSRIVKTALSCTAVASVSCIAALVGYPECFGLRAGICAAAALTAEGVVWWNYFEGVAKCPTD